MNPSEGVREIESLTERLLFSLFHEPMPDYDWTAEKFEELISLAEKRGFERGVEKAARIADEHHDSASVYDTATMQIRAQEAFVIARAIRNLTYEKKGGV